MTRSRPWTEKSMSMSGIVFRPGFRKRSKSRSYLIGSMSVISRQYATSDPDAELHRHAAPLGDLERVPERLRIVGEVLRHLRRALEVELVGVELPALRVRERVPRLDAEERLVCARVLVPEVVDVSGRNEGKPGGLREGGEVGIDLLLDTKPGVLDLQERRSRPEDVTKPCDFPLRLRRLAVLERLADTAREAA